MEVEHGPDIGVALESASTRRSYSRTPPRRHGRIPPVVRHARVREGPRSARSTTWLMTLLIERRLRPASAGADRRIADREPKPGGSPSPRSRRGAAYWCDPPPGPRRPVRCIRRLRDRPAINVRRRTHCPRIEYLSQRTRLRMPVMILRARARRIMNTVLNCIPDAYEFIAKNPTISLNTSNLLL